MTIDAAPTLSDELRAIEHERPGWHLFPSSAGRIWAVTTENHDGGSGTTLDAKTPEGIRREIATQERIWGLRAPCWADRLSKSERRELADMLARWCRRFFEAADPILVNRRARGLDVMGLGHGLMNCSAEMGDLRIDVTERAKKAAA